MRAKNTNEEDAIPCNECNNLIEIKSENLTEFLGDVFLDCPQCGYGVQVTGAENDIDRRLVEKAVEIAPLRIG